MKKTIILIISLIIVSATIYFINPITDKLSSLFGGTPKIVVNPGNKS